MQTATSISLSPRGNLSFLDNDSSILVFFFFFFFIILVILLTKKISLDFNTFNALTVVVTKCDFFNSSRKGQIPQEQLYLYIKEEARERDCCCCQKTLKSKQSLSLPIRVN